MEAGRQPSSKSSVCSSVAVDDTVPCWRSCRIIQLIMTVLGGLVLYSLRVNFNIGILCMVEESQQELENEQGKFQWDKQTQGYLLSAFYWGYVITQLPGGWLSNKFGAKLVMAIGTLLAVVSAFLSVPAANYSPITLAIARFVIGLGQGVYFPAAFTLCSSWAPPDERTRFITVMESGSVLGNVLVNAITGIICDRLGWQWTFLLYGITSVPWLVAWWLLVFDSPSLHPRITQTERKYILESQQGMVDHSKIKNKNVPIPWLKILFSPCTLCLYVASICFGWGNQITTTTLPLYMKDVIGVDIATNGLLNALPHLCDLVTCVTVCNLTDWVIHKKILSATSARKVLEAIHCLLGAVCVFVIGFLDNRQAALAVALLCVLMACNGISRAGYNTAMVDIAPRYSGVIEGISNTCSHVNGLYAPTVVTAITSQGYRSQWQIVFLINAGVLVLGWAVFQLFGTSEIQSWAIIDHGEVENSVPATPPGEYKTTRDTNDERTPLLT